MPQKKAHLIVDPDFPEPEAGTEGLSKNGEAEELSVELRALLV